MIQLQALSGRTIPNSLTYVQTHSWEISKRISIFRRTPESIESEKLSAIKSNRSIFYPVARNRATPSRAGVKVKPFGCCATLTPLVVVARLNLPAPREDRFPAPPRE